MNEQRTHIDLFSGIGGFALAANAAGFRTRVFCEQDDYCAKVLRRHWPDVPVIPDIRDFDGSKWRGAGLLTGGFPCQPFSVAGEQRGEEDDRALWKEMFRVIKEARPRFVLAENVTGLINMALDDVLSQLEGEGYSTGTVVLPACSLNAPHRRDRVWIMAHAGRFQSGSQEKPKRASNDSARCSGRTYARSQEDVAHANKSRLEGWSQTLRQKEGRNSDTGHTGENSSCDGRDNQWSVEPNVGRVANGIPHRTHRLKALGNAIVPQVAYEILKQI